MPPRAAGLLAAAAAACWIVASADVAAGLPEHASAGGVAAEGSQVGADVDGGDAGHEHGNDDGDDDGHEHDDGNFVSEHDDGLKHQCDEDASHESIFTLKAKKLNTWEFWAILAAMIFYGIIIDRAQCWIMAYCEQYRLSKMVFERVVTEFMIFGIVAMTLFLLINVWPCIHDVHKTSLEFADMLVSVAACSLILLAAIYSIGRSCIYEVMSGSVSSILGWKPLSDKQKKVFRDLHGLNIKDFSYDNYFDETLAFEICELINISWKTWLVFFVLCLPMIFEKAWQHHGMDGQDEKAMESEISFESYLLGFEAFSLGVVLVLFLTWVFIRKLRNELYWTLANAPDGVARAEPDQAGYRRPSTDANLADKVIGRGGGDMLDRMKYWCGILPLMLQITSLALCFMLGIYFMHLSYNTDHTAPRLAGAVVLKVIFVTAFVVGLMILGPLALLEVSSIKAFACPDEEVMTAVIDQVHEVWKDVEDIRQQMETKANRANLQPKQWAIDELCRVNGDDTILKSDLQKDLGAIGIRISKKNAANIFNFLDLKYDAGLSFKDMLKRIGGVHEVIDASRSLMEHQIKVDVLINFIFERHMDRLGSGPMGPSLDKPIEASPPPSQPSSARKGGR